MSIVTRGLSKPDALLPSYGLGIGTSFIIIIPLEQLTEAVEVLTSAGIAEQELNITALDPQGLVNVIEYKFDVESITPIQRSAVVDRFMSIRVTHPELDVTVSEINQTVELVEILQLASLDSPNQTIRLIEITEDVDVAEAIDKVQSE